MFAAADPSVLALATEAATTIKENALGVFSAIVPLAVTVLVAKRAFQMARSWVG